jgi:hypothetical protein
LISDSLNIQIEGNEMFGNVSRRFMKASQLQAISPKHFLLRLPRNTLVIDFQSNVHLHYHTHIRISARNIVRKVFHHYHRLQVWVLLGSKREFKGLRFS